MEIKDILLNDRVARAMVNLTGTSIIGISALTDVKLTGGKKNPLQGRVQKRMAAGNVMVFCNRTSNGYENMVHRRLLAEGMTCESFKLGPLPWGQRVENTPFIENKGILYIQTIFLQKPKVEYLVDGVVTNQDQIEGLNVDKTEGEQGGLENKVIVRTFKTKSITGLRYQGTEYNF